MVWEFITKNLIPCKNPTTSNGVIRDVVAKSFQSCYIEVATRCRSTLRHPNRNERLPEQNQIFTVHAVMSNISGPENKVIVLLWRLKQYYRIGGTLLAHQRMLWNPNSHMGLLLETWGRQSQINVDIGFDTVEDHPCAEKGAEKDDYS